ncbi:hypothetical protein [Saccharothrix stipae]
MNPAGTARPTIVVVEVEGPGDVRQVVADALRTAGVPWDACRREDRGSGLFVLVPPEFDRAPLVEALPDALVRALRAHDGAGRIGQRSRLRVAVHAGEAGSDGPGVTSTSLAAAFRLLDAPPVRQALADSPGHIALIVSAQVFDEVVRHSAVLAPSTFRPVPVEVGGVQDTAWVASPDDVRAPGAAASRAADNRAGNVAGTVIQAGTIGQVTSQSPAFGRGQVLVAAGVAVLLVAAVIVAVVLNDGDVTVTNNNTVVIPTTSQPPPESVVAFQGWPDWCGTSYHSPPKVEQALAITDSHELNRVAEGRELTPIRITAQAKGAEDILLTGMRLVEVAVPPPPTTGVMLVPVCGGSRVTPRNFQVDLDHPDPVAKPVPIISDTDGAYYPAVPFPFRISADEPEVFDLHVVRAQPCDCRFVVEMDWVVRGQRGTSRVTDEGEGFRFIVGDALARYRLDRRSGTWVREG